MKKTNWAAFEKSAKQIKKNVKNMSQATELLSDFPPEGYMRDNISKNLVKLEDCKSSSLRRYVKLLDNFYYLISSPTDKDRVLKKKIEVETILNSRDDGIIDKT